MPDTKSYELFKITTEKENSCFIFDKRNAVVEAFGKPVLGHGSYNPQELDVAFFICTMVPLTTPAHYDIDKLYLFNGSGPTKDTIPITGNTMFIKEIYPRKAVENESSVITKVEPLEFDEKDCAIEALDELYRMLKISKNKKTYY